MDSMGYGTSDLISSVRNLDAKAVGGSGREIRRVYRHTLTMPEYADLAERSTRFRRPSPQTIRYARYGWQEEMAAAMEVCDRAVKMVEMDVPVFEPVNSVSGMCVDVSAAVAGLPEDMIDFPVTESSNIGNLITLCSDVQCLGSVSGETVKKRGYLVAGLAMALNRIGYQTTFWISDEYWTQGRPDEKVIIRVLVKGPNDFIDPARIMFAYAHPGVQRELGFAVASSEAGDDGCYGRDLMYASMGSVTTTTKDIGDNCLYMPPIHSSYNSPNIETEIRKFLQVIGVIPGGDDD